MSKVIKNGTIVTADRTWKADVLIKHGKIEAIENGKVAQGQSPVAAKRPMRRTVTL